MRGATLSIAMAGLLAGCATPMKDLSPAFNERDFRWSAKPGTARLTGQAFARTLGGDVKSCAGLPVYLAPVTPYTDAINDALNDGYKNFAPHPPQYGAYVRKSMADVMGGFEFAGLPAGTWYVECDLSYMVASNAYGGQWTGARVSRKVTIADGAVERVVVTPDTVERTGGGQGPVPVKPNFPAPKGLDCRLWC